jgi:hypothetical protein
MTCFEYEGKDYELGMTRAGLRAAEAQGLSASQIAEKPFSALGLLFFASLYSKYHVNPNKALSMLDDLLEDGTLKFGELFEELSEVYVELFGLG